MAVTAAGQETLSSTGFPQLAAAVHRDETSYPAQGSSRLCSTWRCAAAGSLLFYSLPWRDNLKQTKQ